MPELDGLMALRILCEAEIRMPAILITAFGDRWTKAEAVGHGALLLNKPIELKRLRQVVREQLST